MTGEQMATHYDGGQLADSRLAPRSLRCLECCQSSSGTARGWKALASGGYEGDEVEIGVYCPDCFAREFGDA